MTRLRFLLVSALASLGAVLPWRRKIPGVTIAKYRMSATPLHPKFGYVIVYRRNS